MLKTLTTLLLVSLVITGILSPANAAEKRYPEVYGLDEALDICKKSKDAFHMIVPIINPMVIGLETMKAPQYDYCVMLNDVVRDIEYARQLQKKMKTISLNEEKMNQAHALALATFALSQSPVDFSDINAKDVAEIRRKRAGKKMASFYSVTKGINIVDPNYTGNENVEDAQRLTQNFSDLSRRRGVLRELVNCPVPNNEAEKTDAIKVSAEIEEEDTARELRELYYQKLTDAGKLFDREYRKDLKALHRRASVIKVETKTTVENNLHTDTQVFYPLIDQDTRMFDVFAEKYDKRWTQIIKGVRSGIFNSMESATRCDVIKTKVDFDLKNRSLKDFSNKCLMGYVEKSDGYQLQYFRNNLAQYRMWTITQIKLKASILTRESEILKAPIFYSESVTNGQSTVPKPGTMCDRELSYAAMQEARLKSKAISVEYRAVAAEMISRNMTIEQLRQERAQKEAARAEEELRARKKDPKAYWQMFMDLKSLQKVY
ncbi:hypothetical protein [Bdellovibrio sp. BCCA]|uniref:hypothetical protein n=1 Tax=Bdellovibrio sp. BCCA TaxID=3136281 RepID=UPI0030F16810